MRIWFWFSEKSAKGSQPAGSVTPLGMVEL
jgi:hypothetical protein